MSGRPIAEKAGNYEYKSIVIGASSTDVDIKAGNTSLFGWSTSKAKGLPAQRSVMRLTTTGTIQIKYNDTNNDAITITSTESPYIEEDLVISNIYVSSTAGATITLLLKYI